ncbi:threonine synthase [Govanella unica]|uniref:Threonine synthase n=1 Tax=Govanella unica TaxID=2975056 RepID=A0A9X3Z6W4_9PROT|nr:threonine synthase [Govania unica]
MKYVSTRGRAPELDFADVTLTGLARDGGLYVPAAWPQLSAADLRALSGLSYAEAATRIMAPFVAPALTSDQLGGLVEAAYKSFSHQAVVPLVQLDSADWLMELYHGPTLAFKDVALQLLGQFFDHFLTARGQKVTVVGATSGDTGSAAIEACRDRDCVEIFMLHPAGRVSDVQRRQMTTVLSNNVHNIAVDGTFDDCQAMVKAMFNDLEFRDSLHLSAVNSINWARVMAQVVYYVTTAVALGAPDREVAFSVPTGNFGDIYAGYVARQMGVPIQQLIVATNINDILARTFETGAYTKGTVVPTITPSMDIQVSSNFERLLFDLHGRDGAQVTGLMDDFANSGEFRIGATELQSTRALFDATRVSEDETRAAIKATYEATGMLADPHTAVGLAAAARMRRDRHVPMVTLATAHAAKFPDAVEAATGVHPTLPARMGDLMTRAERYDSLPNDLETIKAYIRSHIGATKALA